MSKRRRRSAALLVECLEPRILMFGPVTDYSNVNLSATPSLPAKYGQFTDPDFGTKIIRVTDTTDGNDNHNEYSYYPALNKDNTYLHITRNGVESLYTFNPSTMALNYVSNLFTIQAPGGGFPIAGPIWSGNNANEIICVVGSRIYKYNVASPAYTLIKDFAGTPGWTTGDYIWQLSRSIDDNTFAFTRKNRTGEVYTDKGWQVWRNTGGAGTTLLQSSNTNLDEVQVDKTGNWLVEKFGDSSGDNIWNLSTGTSTFLVDGAPDYSPDHSDNGSGIIVAAENWQNNTTIRNFATPHTFTNIFVPPLANEGGALWQSGHLSMLADNEGWVMKSLQYVGPKTGPFLNELFLVATDGSGRVIRVAHHRTDDSANYWHNSFPSISRDGKFTVFTSNMDSSTRADVFILRNPIPGDANMDYLVDQTDWNTWNANNGGTNKTWAQGDWDADHDVDSADLALWTANQTNPGTPTVTISATDATASETLPNNGVWTITRTGSTSAALTVNFTKSGTATNGTDYNSIGTSVTIPIGASSATVTLTPINDSTIEGDETAILTLATGTGYNIGSPSAATVTILDNDVPSVTISATDATASETLPNNGVFTVTRTGPTTAALVVNFTKSGTATNTSDYSTIGTTVTIPIGSASATVTVTPVDDALVEGTETVILTLASGSGYTVGSPSNATVNITDNDSGSPTPSYDGFGYTVGGGANWNGQSGGTGWGGAWSVAVPADASVLSGSLTYSTLTTFGNKVTLWHQDTANRNTSMTYGTDGTSRWVGILMNAAFSGGTNPALGGLLTLGTQLQIGAAFGTTLGLRTNISGSETFAASSTTPAANTTYFMVVRVDYGTTDVVRLWINPTPGTTPSDASAAATLTLPAGQSFSVGSNLVLNGGGYFSLTNFDELRYGSTYADVAPASGSPPAAPSGLVATPGTSTIGLTWTDNSANETGFKIWRSTDNATWGSPITTTAANATSYTDPSPTQGTGYFYKVAATNGAGDSGSAGMTCAVATVLASDGFNYTTFNGGSTGLGFSNNWTVSAPADSGTTAGSLTYSSGTHALVTSGNRVWLWHQATASRNVSTTYGTNGTSRWLGVLMNATFNGGTNPALGGELTLGSELKIGSSFGTTLGLRTNIGGSETFAASSTTPAASTTYFMVVRIDYGTTDVVRLWINPVPGIVPSDASASATLTLPAGQSFSVGSNLTLNGGGYYSQTTFDELRYGLSYLAVAPDPLIGHGKKTGQNRITWPGRFH